MTSPCSVILIRPSSVPRGWALIAWWGGPPPRPGGPPPPAAGGAAAPVEQLQRHAVLPRHGVQVPPRLVQLPVGGHEPPILVGIGVTQLNLLVPSASLQVLPVGRVTIQHGHHL